MAMQNLRDKLLKAGLVDKKQKQQADTTDRRDKKQKGAEAQALEEAQRARQFAAEQEQKAEAQRQAETSRAAERAEHEQDNRIRNICDRWALRMNKPGQRRFHFVKESRHIGHLLVNDSICDDLLIGALAIVARPGEDEAHLLLPAEPAEKIFELAPGAIRFWAKKSAPIGIIADLAG